MKEVIYQWTGKVMVPTSEEFVEELNAAYKRNQHVKGKTTTIGAQKLPSVEQNNTLHACFTFVADNMKTFDKNTKEKCKFACKVDLHFIVKDMVVMRPDGSMAYQYDTFSFKNHKRMVEENIYQRSFEWMADLVGLDGDKMIEIVKSKMVRRGVHHD